ncbi:MAG: Flp pilus assembly protein CpaB [Bacillota bacterium]
MKNTSLVLLIISIIIAGFLSYAIFINLQNEPAQDLEKKTMIVASQDLKVNQKVTEDMIEKKEVQKDFDLKSYYLEKSEVIGKFVYDDILKGEGFHKSRLSDNKDTILINSIEKNHRAITIAINKYDGVSDLIKPGNFIDIYLFLPEKSGKEELLYPNVAKLFLQNVKVLSVNQSVSRGYESSEEIAKTYPITLSIEKDKIESLVLAENIGFLKLALRPIGETSKKQSYGKVWQELLIDNNLEIRELLPEYNKNSDLLEINDRLESKPDEISKKDEDSKGYTEYKVKYKDTLYSISRKFYDDGKKYHLIKEANNIGNNNLIITGEILKIPKEK